MINTSFSLTLSNLEVVDVLISNYAFEEESIFNKLGLNQIDEIKKFFKELKTQAIEVIKNQNDEITGVEFYFESVGDWKVAEKVQFNLTDSSFEIELCYMNVHLCCTFGSLKFPNCPNVIHLKMSENSLNQLKNDVKKVISFEKSLC